MKKLGKVKNKKSSDKHNSFQKSKQNKITLGLAAASCALLGSQMVQAEFKLPKVGDDWDVSAAILFYSETDRVQAVEPIISAKKSLDIDEFLSFKLAFDTLTGSSANGAIPSSTIQTFTTPSGKSSYETKAGDVPLDDTFRDTRVALSTSWEKPISRRDKIVVGGNISSEYDYLSFSVNGLWSRDFNQKNTTLSAGLSLAADTITPEGGIPIGFSQMNPPDTTINREGSSDNKNTIDLLLGITQIIDSNSLMNINYSLSNTSGYHTDAFKVLSVVDDSTGRPEFLSGSQSKVLYELRPEDRSKQSIYTQYKRNLSGNVVDLSYRYLWDDWGLTSNTIDIKYRWALEGKRYLQPHFRFYQQSAVDFYEPFLLNSAVDGNTLPEFATADYRLGDFDAYTIGLEYGLKNWRAALEYYKQTGKEPDGKFGELNNQNLGVDLDAIMLRINYDF
jgi:hypothetical protein